MNITKSIKNRINTIPKGKLFSYQDLPNYAKSTSAVIKAVNRLIANKELARLSKGKFYVPQTGNLLLKRKPSDSELIRSVIYKNGCQCGYITGIALFNQLGLTTQVPQTVTIACNGGSQLLEYDTINIQKTPVRAPVTKNNAKLLQYLDALKDIKKIPDANINRSLKRIGRFLLNLTLQEKKQLAELAIIYYTGRVRALLGMLLNPKDVALSKKIRKSLNPITIYKIGLDQNQWPLAKEWNIK